MPDVDVTRFLRLRERHSTLTEQAGRRPRSNGALTIALFNPRDRNRCASPIGDYHALLWFYAIIVLCAVIATAAFSCERVAAARAARWTVPPGEPALIDTWHSVACSAGAACGSLEERVSRAKRAARQSLQ